MKKTKRVFALLLAVMFVLSSPGQTLASYGVGDGTDNRLESINNQQGTNDKENVSVKTEKNSGLTATMFGTGRTCIRADVVSFLYRTLV